MYIYIHTHTHTYTYMHAYMHTVPMLDSKQGGFRPLLRVSCSGKEVFCSKKAVSYAPGSNQVIELDFSNEKIVVHEDFKVCVCSFLVVYELGCVCVYEFQRVYFHETV
jgi:hypothetical protein